MSELKEDQIREFLGASLLIELGSVVYLNSGSPAMTVKSIQDDKVRCEWFDKTDKVRTHEFSCVMLTRAKVNRDGKSAGLIVIGELTSDAGVPARATHDRSQQ